MKQYIKPSISSYNIVIHRFIASSKPVDSPNIETKKGGFYKCNLSMCTPNDYTWQNNNDNRNIQVEGTKYQYIGCYEYKSNGSDVTCEYFYTMDICEGKRYDLYISADGKYYVQLCEDDWMHNIEIPSFPF